jgi:hypothetical protein
MNKQIVLSAFAFLFSTGGNASTLGAHYPSISVMEAYIVKVAPRYGIDPKIALRVAHSEGLNEAAAHVGYAVHDPRKYSYGPWQLHMDGLGDRFDFGRHPTNVNWKGQTDYALNYASHNGWGSWYGAAKVGVRSHCGIHGGACGRLGPWHVKRVYHWRPGHHHFVAGHWQKHHVFTTPHRHHWVWNKYGHHRWRRKH